MFGICSELTIKRPERRQRRRSGVFIVNLEHMSQIFGGVSVVDLEQVNVGWAFYLFSVFIHIFVHVFRQGRTINEICSILYQNEVSY